VSLMPQQRAQVLYLHQVEGVSLVLLAVMTGLPRSAVSEVLEQARRQEATAAERRPWSKGHVERRFQYVRLDMLRKGAS
jgi:DNA-directed RNA polymerase specialized sigma24 family protein